MKKKLKLSKYEKCLLAVAENVVQKMTASIVLYDTKFAYTSALPLATGANRGQKRGNK